ncbi:glutathione S-transferase family protein [Actibacterium sp. 188UL27-1]|uniref:glutathione S-transferase family protein n=1 Tax=Actibacterium sp. 188UL27-1 TaxID=2786961 RepID=UPI00195729D5|nr:glutathione S-transferase family protein [Actibacterium sp. 188UL27-1]MBM7067163.1 glutathione S-transferase family protein [Actibacterium sp. 188UL27-1]
MYTVIGGTKSRAMRVIWMLEELEQSFEHVAAPPRSDDVVAVNPAGKVPVLVVDQTPILDSTAILTYLADKHGSFTYPAGTIERARQDSLTQFLLDEFDAALWMAARHSFILPEELRQSAVKDSLKWEFERSQRTLIGRMGDGDYLMGDTITVPDIILAHCMGWAISARFPISQSRLEDYTIRMQARPAFERASAR